MSGTAVIDEVVPAGEPWMGVVRRGQRFRIVDLEGNQAVDTLFYNAADTAEHYSAQNTIQSQQRIYLTTGTVLLSNRGNPMLRMEEDTCGRHDTLGGACSAESNTVRYALDKRHMHSCRDSFLLALAKHEGAHLTKRDLPSNINFFMNVPVTPAGQLRFADGISAAGRHVEMAALMDTLVLISNCPQLNNPCNAYNPTPIRVMTWDRA
ncbi:MAG TPA: urea amidolyase associated protein UAAP2 [Steroidobacteraceae bacterium]|nr:urea amidolyase associated protein UAAP2 [Steroidobacteraceae bacterium]